MYMYMYLKWKKNKWIKKGIFCFNVSVNLNFYFYVEVKSFMLYDKIIRNN